MPTNAGTLLKSGLTSSVPQLVPLRAEPLADGQLVQDVPAGVEPEEVVVGAALVVTEKKVIAVGGANIESVSKGELEVVVGMIAA